MKPLRASLFMSASLAGLMVIAGCAGIAAEDGNSVSVSERISEEDAGATTHAAIDGSKALRQRGAFAALGIPIVAPAPEQTFRWQDSLAFSETRAPDLYGPYEFVPSEYNKLDILSPFNEVDTASPAKSVDQSFLFGLNDWATSPVLSAVRGQLAVQRLAYGTLGQERYDAKITLAAPSAKTGLNFDLGLVPSVSYAEEGDFRVRRVGAEFRLGQDIDQRGNYSGLPSWYFFAGADGEAVIFNNATAGNGLGLIDGLQLRDQITVGDIQAGLNVRQFGTNIAFNYIRREVEYELNSETIQRNENFGGVTLTWSR